MRRRAPKPKTYEQLSDRQRAIVGFVCERACEQGVAGEAVGVLVGEVRSQFKMLNQQCAKSALAILARDGFLSMRRTFGQVETPFTNAGCKMQKLVVYSPGPSAPS